MTDSTRERAAQWLRKHGIWISERSDILDDLAALLQSVESSTAQACYEKAAQECESIAAANYTGGIDTADDYARRCLEAAAKSILALAGSPAPAITVSTGASPNASPPSWSQREYEKGYLKGRHEAGESREVPVFPQEVLDGIAQGRKDVAEGRTVPIEDVRERISQESDCEHTWIEEYYGYRCSKCDCFVAYGCEPWAYFDEYENDSDYPTYNDLRYEI